GFAITRLRRIVLVHVRAFRLVGWRGGATGPFLAFLFLSGSAAPSFVSVKVRVRRGAWHGTHHDEAVLELARPVLASLAKYFTRLAAPKLAERGVFGPLW